MKHFPWSSIVLVASIVLAASCASSKPSPPAGPPLSDDALVQKGARSFSEGRLSEAQAAWSAISDSNSRSLYLSYVLAYASCAESAADAEKALTLIGPEAAAAAVKRSPPLPAPPPAVAADPDPLGAVERLQRVGEMSSRALVASASDAERAADADLDAARSGEGKDPQASAGKALGGFVEASRLYRGASGLVPQAEKDAEEADAKALVAKELHDRLLRQSLLSFPDRMGEVFARSPTATEKMSDRDLLDFNAKTASIISAGIADFDKTVAEHPGLLDAATLERLRGTAKELSARFARMDAAIKAVKDRGKPIMPLIIGIFNPQPGDPQRSRPASFFGRLVGGSDWWVGHCGHPQRAGPGPRRHDERLSPGPYLRGWPSPGTWADIGATGLGPRQSFVQGGELLARAQRGGATGAGSVPYRGGPRTVRDVQRRGRRLQVVHD